MVFNGTSRSGIQEVGRLFSLEIDPFRAAAHICDLFSYGAERNISKEVSNYEMIKLSILEVILLVRHLPADFMVVVIVHYFPEGMAFSSNGGDRFGRSVRRLRDPCSPYGLRL